MSHRSILNSTHSGALFLIQSRSKPVAESIKVTVQMRQSRFKQTRDEQLNKSLSATHMQSDIKLNENTVRGFS